MIQLFQEGGVLFMSIISILLLFLFFQFFRAKHKLVHIGALACCTGVLGTSIGVYSALQAIPELGGVSQEMLANGMRVASITGIYGLIVFMISIVLSYIKN